MSNTKSMLSISESRSESDIFLLGLPGLPSRLQNQLKEEKKNQNFIQVIEWF